ncbi:hypothetical protein GCM10009789_83800 [Kribbella sancticallisti]|uniref:Uncharacterized protein n=1 Tax=Kribbella sancticallisti TaxID=460087 RepID=A0ABN2ET81_9ACTN
MYSAEVARIAPLSRDQSTVLVKLSLAAAITHGFTVAYDRGVALVSTDSSGAVLGLSNLARTVAQHDRSEWPRLIEEHFGCLARQLRQGPPAPPADPVNELIQRLVPRDALPADWTADRPDFLPGLVAVPATINDGTVTMYLDPADLGLTWSAADSFGLANLQKLAAHVEHEEIHGVGITFVTGTSFAASKALVLDTVLRDSLNVEAPQYGVLAALPTRDVLMLHVVEDLSVISALGHLLNLAARSHATGQGPLTPAVYWVSPEQTWHPATAASPNRTSLRLSPNIEALTRDLAAREESSR